MNRFKPKDIKEFQSVFKNEGRGSVKKDRVAIEKGKWDPTIGTYNPNTKAINVNDQDKLNKMAPEPDTATQDKLIDLRKRQQKLCPKFEKTLKGNSIFSVGIARLKMLDTSKKELAKNEITLRNLKVKTEVRQAFGLSFVDSLVKMAQ